MRFGAQARLSRRLAKANERLQARVADLERDAELLETDRDALLLRCEELCERAAGSARALAAAERLAERAVRDLRIAEVERDAAWARLRGEAR